MSSENMDNNLNRAGIKDYSTRYSKKLIDTYFKSNKSITGGDIKSLADISQINLFVIKNLFEEWQKETDNLKSNYFDYQSEGVKSALTEFMNVLSRNISIKKDHFEPLLIRAVEESVLLIFSPYDFYTHLAEHSNGEMTLENLKRTLKYVRVNKNLLENLVQTMEERKLDKVNDSTYADLINEVFQNIQASPDDIGVYFDNFSKIEPLQESDIYGVLMDEKPAVEPAPIEAEAEEKEEGPSISKVEPTEDEDLKTINDIHASEAEEPTIAEIHQTKGIDNLNAAMSINQRFMFKNALFNGDDKAFEDTIAHIENCRSKEEAMKYIYKEFPQWNIESEEFEEFVELIEKRLK
ncbi:hypothetical protein [Fulvivirga lutimaris]|uniref:hypothetical protein n=1 Tax=Fulvivirga lutimaris TaxID=1819566 RepID=UPI0012BC94F6|nr:hypothetical protein [Fulvivirga lutimaris]MTI41516.1 hypothetical protein [Fulvivirga lutimaris]